ncbi:MAG: hypothetical protein JXA36_07400, partial [Coriobacteriia bacterium]|nr:hypothetical protein [Coriobacteriia bacterium]
IGWATMPERDGALPARELVPEAAATIDGLLNPQVETSRAVRSAIAVFFPWLVATDGEWGRIIRDKVFPAEADQEQLWRVAWASFVCWNRPSLGLYSLLETRYERALGDATDAYPSSVTAQYAERIAEHVGLLMLWGAIDPNSDLVATFLNGPDSVTARSLMHFLGRCFADIGDAQRADGNELPDDLVAQMVTLWDERMAMHAESGSTEDWSELGSFGLWFASGLFEPTWATDVLSAIGSRGHKIDRPDLVRGRLRWVFDGHPLRALNCLESLLASASASVLFRGGRDEVSEMLALASSNASEDVVVAGTRLRNRLVARGFLGYAESDADE